MADLRLLAEGHTISVFEDEDGAFEWPRCAIYGCRWYARLAEPASIYCTPHALMHEAGATVLDMMACADIEQRPPEAQGDDGDV